MANQVELLPLDPLDDSYNRVGWFDYVNFPEIQCDQKDSAISTIHNWYIYMIDCILNLINWIADVVGLVCPFTKDHYVTLVDENQNEVMPVHKPLSATTINFYSIFKILSSYFCVCVQQLSISLGHAIEERFKEEQLSVWSVFSLKGLRLKGCDASTASVSAPRIKTCDDSVLQV